MLQPEDFERSWVNPPTPHQVHAPTVVGVPGGLVAAWFEGSHEGAPDTRIHLARSSGDGWLNPTILDPEPVPHWNPVLTTAPTGELWLYFKRGERISTWETWFCLSHDEGRTWSEPRPLVEGPQASGGRGPVKNPLLHLGDTWLAPGSIESWGSEPRWDAFVDITTDEGATWEKVPIPLDHTELSGAGIIQPALWASSDRRTVHALMRSSEGRAYRSTSLDQGRTWSAAEPTSLPNNNSGLALVRLDSGTVIAAHNPVVGDWAPRCPLALSRSLDDGRTWEQIGIVEDGAMALDEDPEYQPIRPDPRDAPRGGDGGVTTTGRGEYSYPSLFLEGDTLTICYTWQRRRIVSAQISRDRLEQTSPIEKKAQ